ncbi:MAG: ATP-binding cassette domain-containing protein [Atopobiaceae bacterium]|nr:ATP-binding cassette domain-containing protein [Atopobiaceae bacterium]MCI2172762.1 ATP-binding cassette domain-containing protein [Atopobiaceae bacterium]MCI2207069.1 ATP-binding cassette domain-containing protein [Atopobiaceae bacterium]
MLQIKDLIYTVKPGQGSYDDHDHEIIRGLDLTVETGRLVVVTGPNGGGKSTTAKLVMGIEQPTGGTITFDGTDVTHMPIDERARLGIGYGFQQPAKFQGMKVGKLIRIASGEKLSGAACNRFLTSVGLCSADYLMRDVDKSLSGGELKRIEIATVLARNPKLAIFDEPEAGIDLWSFERLCETFEELHHKEPDHTIVIISHQERIMALADDIVVIEDGRVVRQGPRDEVYPTLGFGKNVDPSCAFTREKNVDFGAAEAAARAAVAASTRNEE